MLYYYNIIIRSILHVYVEFSSRRTGKNIKMTLRAALRRHTRAVGNRRKVHQLQPFTFTVQAEKIILHIEKYENEEDWWWT